MKRSTGEIMAVLIALLLFNLATAQSDPAWDDTRSNDWPGGFEQVEITSTVDQKTQSAYFYRAKGDQGRPLVVSLHTWSGGYDQKDTLSWLCVEKNYNYIHPDFRGPNNQPEACGSTLAIQDIDDAIEYAIRHGRVDTAEIHIIGVSGGGYATLLAYMKTKYQIKTFSAWASITNLEDWYYESVGREQKYARDIALATNPDQATPGDYALNAAEARQRSPYYMTTPADRRQNSKLYIYAGIHDGYTGSVPITQSLKFYNKLVRDFAPEDTSLLIPAEEMLSLVERRNSNFVLPAKQEKGAVHLQKKYQDKIQITIFEGTHEMLTPLALEPLNDQKILAIGDSNGALETGWVSQLRQLSFQDRVYNTCISGNTIGFDNLGKQQLNTLSNVDQYLASGVRALNGLDKIIILLGTNDCKAIFDDSLAVVPKNLEKLIKKIQAHAAYRQFQPKIYVVSPPPYAPDAQLIPKYQGGAADIAWLFPRFREVAEKTGCTFIDIYTQLLPKWAEVSADGIHLKPEGQRWIAGKIIGEW